MSPRTLRGVGCAPGRAAGRAWLFRPPSPRTGALTSRLEALRRELVDARRASIGATPDELAHYEVVLALIDDPELSGPALRLERAGLPVHEAIDAAFQPAIARLLVHGDPELAARASELRTLRDRLLVRSPLPPPLARPVILLARDLSADQLLDWLGPSGRGRLRALLLERGGPLTHTSILARQRGLPVVGGVNGLLDGVEPGESVLVDADRGLVLASPGPDEARSFRAHRVLAPPRPAPPRPAPPRPAPPRPAPPRPAPPRPAPPRPASPQQDALRTDAGLLLFANVDSPEESRLARRRGAEGLSLVRTDALLSGGRDPGEEEQVDHYRRILQPWEGRRAWVRTFDAPEPGADAALGPRGVRWLDLAPDRFRRQLRALCRAAASLPEVQTGVLLPMVCRPSELRAVRSLLGELGPPGSPSPELGCMVETPAAALRIDELLDEADFVAVGTNDLLQFLVGASREDHRLGGLLDPEDPSLWELLGRVGAASRARGRPAVVCGALAESASARARLRELGFLGLGIGPASLPHGRNSSRRGG